MTKNQSLIPIIKNIFELKRGYHETKARSILMLSVDADAKHGFAL